MEQPHRHSSRSLTPPLETAAPAPSAAGPRHYQREHLSQPLRKEAFVIGRWHLRPKFANVLNGVVPRQTCEFAKMKLVAVFCAIVGGMLSTEAHAQSLSGIRVGDPIQSTSAFGKPPNSRTASGPFIIQKWMLPDGNEISVTSVRDSGKIVFLASDWGGQNIGAFADLPGMVFGKTTLADIRARYGSNGYMYKAHGPAQIVPEGVIMRNSYGFANLPTVAITFVTKITRNPGKDIANSAKLDSIILADTSYVDVIWGSEKIPDPAYRPISWDDGAGASKSTPNLPSIPKSPEQRSAGVVNFAAYPSANPRFHGLAVKPQFTGRDKNWSLYRTRIRNAVKEGPNFAGRIVIFPIGCGTGCVFYPAVDLTNGKVFSFPLGGEEHPYLRLKYQIDSRAVSARWMSDEECLTEVFEWTGAAFRGLGSKKIGGETACWED